VALLLDYVAISYNSLACILILSIVNSTYVNCPTSKNNIKNSRIIAHSTTRYVILRLRLWTQNQVSIEIQILYHPSTLYDIQRDCHSLFRRPVAMLILWFKIFVFVHRRLPYELLLSMPRHKK